MPLGVLTLARLKPLSVKSTTTFCSLLEISLTSGPVGSFLLMLVHCWANVIADKATNMRDKNSFFICLKIED
jgi:hypothetical protein